MSAEPLDALERVAEAVSDGTPIDWQGELAARPELSEPLLRLSQLERVREAHGGVTVSADLAVTKTQGPSVTSSMPPERASEAVPVFLWGPLRVLEMVGEGSGGRVFRAFDPKLQTEVALKLCKRDSGRTRRAVEDFLSEGRRLARVRHPNILIVHGADEHDDQMGIWTEFVRGKSLEEYLQQSGPLSAREATLIGLDICRALAAVHAARLVHCDVKTRNVMREEGGRIILTDFGSMGEIRTSRTSAGGDRGAGTPITMAPEQLRGEEPKPTADIYGLGVLLYRMVSGRYPIEANSQPELFEKHLRGERVPLRDRRADLPIDFVDVVERAIVPDAGQRYASAGEMERALAATLGALPETVKGDEEDRKRILWRRALTAASLGGIVLVVSGLALWVQRPVWFSSRKPFPAASNPAPPAEPQVPLAVTAGLFRRANSKDQPLPASGGRVSPGDQLSMTIRGNGPMHAYVLNEDTAGRLYVLFPIPDVSPRNPLAADVGHRLPGQMGDSLIYWTVTSVGGRESIVAIASRAPLAELDSLIAVTPRATPGMPVELDSLDLPRLRGIGGITKEGTTAPESRRWLKETIDGLAKRANGEGDVWVWEALLENPSSAP